MGVMVKSRQLWVGLTDRQTGGQTDGQTDRRVGERGRQHTGSSSVGKEAANLWKKKKKTTSGGVVLSWHVPTFGAKAEDMWLWLRAGQAVNRCQQQGREVSEGRGGRSSWSNKLGGGRWEVGEAGGGCSLLTARLLIRIQIEMNVNNTMNDCRAAGKCGYSDSKFQNGGKRDK